MAYLDYATYAIFFHDRNEYEFAVAAVGGTLETGGEFDGSPVHAAQFFEIPIPFPSGNMDDIPKGIYFNSGYFPGKELNNFAPPSVIMNDTTDEYVVPGYPGSNGIGSGQSRTIRWRGIIIYMQGEGQTTPTPTAIPQRRFIGGLEHVTTGEGGTGLNSSVGCRDSSRTVDGIGFAARGQNTTGLGIWLRQLDQYNVGFTTRRSWERLYFRPRIAGVGIVAFWRCHSSVSPNAGATLTYNADGSISLYSVTAGGVITLKATSAVLDAMKWYKLDIILEYPDAPAATGLIDIYINGQLSMNYVDATGDSMDTVGFHRNSEVGKGMGLAGGGGNDAQVEYDLDDWINADWPNQAGILFLDSIDWLMGSHVRRTRVLSGTNVGYTPNAIQIMNQMHNPDQQLNAQFSSTTALALLEGLTDLPQIGIQDKFGEVALGAVAAIIGINSSNAGAADGQLGYNVAGAGNVMATINEQAISTYNTVAYRPSGLIEPTEITPFLVRYTKSNDANNATVRGLGAILEYIGIWGQEDVIDPELFPDERPRTNWLHNCNYPNTPYAFMGPTVETLVFAVGGIYVGNGTQQDILLPDACHMLFIRALTGGVNGVKWFACAMGGHMGTTERVVPNAPTRVWYDPSISSFKFTVAGSNAESNALGVTYQYIAFCDPGMRFCSTGAFNNPNVIAERTNNLQNPTFLPEFAFAQVDMLNITSSNQGLFARGPGNAGTTGNLLNGAAGIANFGTFANGLLISRQNLHPLNQAQVNYAAFRSSEPNCGWVMLQIMSYVGDGTGNRVINLTPISGRFPLFALVIPTNSSATVFRDPSHAGANSSNFSTLAAVASGIIAGGVDQITVGSALNANGITYNVFVIPGDLLGWNNGTFFPPNCDSPSPFFNPVMDPPEVAVAGDGGILLGAVTALTILKDVSGLYTLSPGKLNDTIYNRINGASTEVRAIPNPMAKTGFING